MECGNAYESIPHSLRLVLRDACSMLAGMNSFHATYNGSESLSAQEDAVQAKERYDANWERIQAAGVIDGLILHSRQSFMGSFCVSGDQARLDALKEFLETNGLGTIIANEPMIKTAD